MTPPHSSTCPDPNGRRVLGSLIARGELDALMACDHPHHETPKKFLVVSKSVFGHRLLPTFAKEAAK